MTDIIKRVATLTGRAAYTSSAATVLISIPSISQAQQVEAKTMELSEIGVWVGIGCAVFTALVSSASTVVFKWLEYRASLKAKGLDKAIDE